MFPTDPECGIIVGMPDLPSDVRLTRAEITKLAYKWIGVDGGYLGRFSYASHDRFWLDVCDVPISTAAFNGTTRACFEATLFEASAADQAAVLRALLDEYPLGEDTPTDELARNNFRRRSCDGLRAWRRDRQPFRSRSCRRRTSSGVHSMTPTCYSRRPDPRAPSTASTPLSTAICTHFAMRPA